MSKLRLLFALIFLTVIVAGAGAFFVYRFRQPVGAEGKVEIVINPGESIQEIGRKLDEADLVDSTAFILYVRFKNLTTKIQAGRYEIPLTLSPVQIVALLQHGTFDVRLTFLEGWRKEEYLEYALSKLAVDDEAFSAEFLKETEGLEGYLFPDTYSVSIRTAAPELAAKLRANFDRRYRENVSALEKEGGLSQSQIVIIASLLERETSAGSGEDERRTVAGILVKRWKSGWRLDVDATIQYILGYRKDTKEWWTVDRSAIVAGKQIDSAYNTYKYQGLPLGPISNPGLSALRAAANSKDSPYWFYLHDEEGEIHYARTLQEHNQNVDKYLR